MPIKINNGQSMVIVKKDNVEMNEVRVNNVLVHKRVTITFNGNGGTPTSRTQTRTYEVEQIIQPTAPTRSGYTFKGWYTSSSGGTRVTFPRNTPLNNTTYYAQWTASTPPAGLKWRFNRTLPPATICFDIGASLIGSSCSTLNATQTTSGYHDGYSGCIELICKA